MLLFTNSSTSYILKAIRLLHPTFSMKKRRRKEPKEHISRDILLDLLKAGVGITVAVVAPNALHFLKPLVEKKREWEQYYPSSVSRCATALWRKGLVDVRETPEGYSVTISDKGRQEVLRYDVADMSIPRQDPWDEKWRMVFFDIPAGEKVRHVFREHLMALGFFLMQESVYVHPYPCHKQIRFLREVYNIPHQVKLATVNWIENDRDLRSYYHLTPQI